MSGSMMPPGGGAPSPSSGGATPPAAGGGASPAPPIGSSTATGPSQNLGATAQGNQIAAAVVQGLTLAMTKVPPGTPLFKALSKAHFEIGKEIEPGAASPAGVSNAMKSMAMQQGRMAPHAGAMTTQAGGPAAGAAAPPPKPPMAA